MIFLDISGKRDTTGGLGNNLFKIAAAASLSKKYNDDLAISLWRYNIFKEDRIRFGIMNKNSDIKKGCFSVTFFIYNLSHEWLLFYNLSAAKKALKFVPLHVLN